MPMVLDTQPASRIQSAIHDNYVEQGVALPDKPIQVDSDHPAAAGSSLTLDDRFVSGFGGETDRL